MKCCINILSAAAWMISLLSIHSVLASPVDSELLSLAKQYQQRTDSLSKVKLTRLLMDVQIDVNESTVVKTVTSLWYYPTQASLQDGGYDKIYFNGHSQIITDLHAVSLSENGNVDWFNPADARVLDSDSYNVFSEGKEKVINYVGLQQGSISALRYTVETNLNKLEVPWSDLIYVQGYSENREVKIRVSGNVNLPIFADASSELISCKKVDITITCEGQNIPKLENRDYFYFRDVATHVALSTQNNWDDIISNMLNAYDTARSENLSVIRQLSNMISDEMSLEEQISTIHQYVARDIRYLSESEAGNAYTPHSVSRTVDKKYGDCKDKTVLLLEMFQQIGIDAHPVLISTSRKMPNNIMLPSAAYFNHVIMCFSLSGKDYCIDATDSTSDWRYMSQWVQGHVALPLKKGASVTRSLLEPHAYGIENQTKIKILDNGGQLEQQKIAFQGAYASEYRSRLEKMEENERRDYAVEIYQDYVSADALPTVKVTGVEALEKPIIFETEYEFAPFLDMSEEISVIEYEPWIRGELNSYNPDNREYEINYAGSRVVSTITVSLPEGWQTKSYPADLNLKGPFASITRKVTRNADGGFTIFSEFSLPAGTFSVAQQTEFKDLLEVLKDQATVRYTAKKTSM